MGQKHERCREDRPKSSHDITNFGHYTGWWIGKYIVEACRGTIDLEGLPRILDTDKAEDRCHILTEKLKGERQKGKRVSLLSCLMRSAKGPLLFAILLTYLSEILKFTQPFLIGKLVAHFAGSDITLHEAYACAAGLVLVNLFFSCIFSTYSFLYQYAAMEMKTACVSVIFKKVARLKISYTEEVDSGFILNLLSADTERFHTALVTFQGFVAGPFSLLALFILLGVRVGLSTLPALLFIIILFVVRMAIGKSVGKLRGNIAQWTDRRLQLTAEMVKRMKTVKMQSWEERLMKKISSVRRCEMRLVLRQMFFLALNLVLGIVGIKTTIALILVTHYLLQHNITPQLVVEVVTWVQLSDYIVFTMFPLSMGTLYQLVESVKRIQFFLDTGEISNEDSTSVSNPGHDSNKPIGITMERVVANWKTLEDTEESAPSSPLLSPPLSRTIRSPSPRGLASSKMFVTSPTPTGTPIVFPISPLLVAPSVVMASMTSQVPSVPATPISDITGDSLFPSMPDSLDNQHLLSDVSLFVDKTELVVILGGVGAGKTSLLMAIMGFLPTSQGKIEVRGSVAYVPQEAWLINDTLEENILMGKVKDDERYTRVIKACQLEEDLLQFPSGDKTLIGESDTCLSGGQKSRINLARAVYQDADIYLLDDPLSALDVNVGKKIFDCVVCGLLKDKCRLLVTHQHHLIEGVGRVIILEDGSITDAGSYSDVAQRTNFQRTISRDSATSSTSSCGGSKWSLLKVALKLRGPSLSRMSSSSTFHDVPLTDVEEKADTQGPEPAYLPLDDVDPSQRSVKITVYFWYLRAGCGQVLLPVILIITLTIMAASIFADVFATKWGADEEVSSNREDLNSTNKFYNITKPSEEGAELTHMYIYMSIIAGFIAGCLIQSVFVACMVWLAARNLYKKLQNSVMNAAMAFFERNTFGSVLNRFSRDTSFVDERFILPTFLTVGLASSIVAYLVYASFVKRYAVAATIPFLLLTLLLRQTAIYAIRDFKRMEVKLKAPVLAHMSAILDGIPVIRAFKLEDYMLTGANRFIDRHTTAWYSYLCAQRWLQFNLLLLSTTYLAIVVILAVVLPSEGMSGGALGLTLTYIISMMIQIQELMKWTTELESYMTSVERLRSYSDLESEHLGGGPKHPEGWPTAGQITFTDVTLTYPSMDEPTLDNINFKVEAGEKIGIVGRTGAGKSSLFLALLRLQEVGGTITIDDVSIKDVGLKHLRNAISVIPQDPVIMSGTLRETLDPSYSLSDEKIWEALEKVSMKERVEQLTPGLDFEVFDGGYEFSVGQRQLLCLARALLKDTKIVIIDEATASIDERTFSEIEKTIKEQTASCSVLNIAHRLNTVISYDRVMVLEKGRIVELDHPHQLLQDASGYFHQMVQQTGKDTAARLKRKAYLNYKRKSSLKN